MKTIIALVLLSAPSGPVANVDDFALSREHIHSYACESDDCKSAIVKCNRLQKALATNRELAACVRVNVPTQKAATE